MIWNTIILLFNLFYLVVVTLKQSKIHEFKLYTLFLMVYNHHYYRYYLSYSYYRH